MFRGGGPDDRRVDDAASLAGGEMRDGRRLRCRDLHPCRRVCPEQRARRDSLCPEAALRAVPGRLLLLCLLRRTSWLTVDGDRNVDAAGVLHRRGGRAAVAGSVDVAGCVRKQRRWRVRRARSRRLRVAQLSNVGLAQRDCCSFATETQVSCDGSSAKSAVTYARPRPGSSARQRLVTLPVCDLGVDSSHWRFFAGARDRLP